MTSNDPHDFALLLLFFAEPKPGFKYSHKTLVVKPDVYDGERK